jgi:hypothetical protein
MACLGSTLRRHCSLAFSLTHEHLGFRVGYREIRGRNDCHLSRDRKVVLDMQCCAKKEEVTGKVIVSTNFFRDSFVPSMSY